MIMKLTIIWSNTGMPSYGWGEEGLAQQSHGQSRSQKHITNTVPFHQSYNCFFFSGGMRLLGTSEIVCMCVCVCVCVCGEGGGGAHHTHTTHSYTNTILALIIQTVKNNY